MKFKVGDQVLVLLYIRPVIATIIRIKKSELSMNVYECVYTGHKGKTAYHYAPNLAKLPSLMSLFH